MILLYTHEILDWPFTETMIYLRKKDITGLAIYRNYDLQNVLTTKSMLDINSNYFILYFYMLIDSHLFFQFKQLYLILLCLVVTY
jgi:hypothetical protein